MYQLGWLTYAHLLNDIHIGTPSLSTIQEAGNTGLQLGNARVSVTLSASCKPPPPPLPSTGRALHLYDCNYINVGVSDVTL